MEMFPPPGPNPFDKTEVPVKAAIMQMKMLSNLATDYASSVERLVKAVVGQDDPYRGGNSDALLAVVAARDVHRIAQTVQNNDEIPDLLTTSIRLKVENFQTNHPHLKTARDVIQHADAYISSDGFIREHWFDITKRFVAGQFHLRISHNLDINMTQLAADAVELAIHVDKTVNIWMGLEIKMGKAAKFAQQLVDGGFSAKIEIHDDHLEIVTIEKIHSSSEALVTLSIRI